MPVDPRLVSKMRRHVAALEALRAEVEVAHGKKLCLFAEGGHLHLIEIERDTLNCSHRTAIGPRGCDYEDGGSILADLGGSSFDGGGW